MNWHHAYQLWHLSWLAGIAGTSILLSLACRRNWIPHVYIRALLFSVIVGGEIMRFFTDDVHWPDTLPLNLCNVSSLVAAFACLTLARGASEFVYFPGLTAAAMALLTPDLGGVWPARFFVSHGAIIIAACVLVYGRLTPLQRGALWRGYAWFSVYIFSTLAFDLAFKANYSYLREKPKATTLLTFFGPWPWYIAGSGAVALFLFWLLWLPARTRSARVSSDERNPNPAAIFAAERP